MTAMLRIFRREPQRTPVPMPPMEPAAVCPNPLPVQTLVETAEREILLLSREQHAIQNPAPMPGVVESAAGFPLHIYKDLFQEGPAQFATFAHVCRTADGEPLLVYSAPRKQCTSPSSSPRATNHPTS